MEELLKKSNLEKLLITRTTKVRNKKEIMGELFQLATTEEKYNMKIMEENTITPSYYQIKYSIQNGGMKYLKILESLVCFSNRKI